MARTMVSRRERITLIGMLLSLMLGIAGITIATVLDNKSIDILKRSPFISVNSALLQGGPSYGSAYLEGGQTYLFVGSGVLMDTTVSLTVTDTAGTVVPVDDANGTVRAGDVIGSIDIADSGTYLFEATTMQAGAIIYIMPQSIRSVDNWRGFSFFIAAIGFLGACGLLGAWLLARQNRLEAIRFRQPVGRQVTDEHWLL